jgi:hypothetical protein
MEHESKLYNLLAKGLLDIRLAAHEDNAKVAFHISDLLHNVPLQISRAHQEKKDCSDILEWVRMRAEQKGMSKWLDNALSEKR